MADYVVDNISIEIEASVKTGIEAIDKLIEATGRINNELKDVISNAKKMGNEFSSASSKVSTSSRQIDKSMNETKKSTDGVSKSINGAFKVGAIVMFAKTLKNGFETATRHSMDYIQNNNLLNMTMGESIDKAREFTDAISNSLGLDPSGVMKYQANYQMLATSFGVANENALLLSENVTKLTYDMSAMHGVDYDQMFSRLSSGLAGQSKQMLMMGIDVTSAGLQSKLDSLGIDAMVSELNQAEKVLLRYITMIDQSRVAHGAMAKSIESPMNQIRIFKEQIAQLYTWIGNTFITLFSKALPYINAFVMAIKEVVKSLALMFGYKLSDYNFKNTGIGGLGDDFGTVGKNADTAKKKVKQLKEQVFGKWNELNIVKSKDDTETPDYNTPGIGSGGAFYDDLSKSLKGYDNLMGDVSKKTQKIRNDILDWLGFLYDINPLTGEISNLKFGGWKEMSKELKIILGILGLITGFKIAGKIMTAVGAVKKFLSAALGIKTMTGAVASWSSIWAGIKVTIIGASTAVGGFLSSVGSLVGGGAVAGLGLVAGAIALVAGGAWLVYDGFKPAIEEVNKFADVSEKTKERMKPFEASFTDLNNKLTSLSWSKAVVSQKDVDEVVGNLNTMTNHIKDTMMADLNETKEKLINGDLFQGLDPLAKQGIVEKMEEGMKKNSEIVDGYSKQITNIVQNASNENRAITAEEQETINGIQDLMYENAVSTLSASQKDQDTIMRNIKDNASKLSAQQASDLVKNSLETKKTIIKDAEERYGEEMRIADDLWERGVISKEQHDEMTKIAKEGYDNTLADAETNHQNIIDGAKEHSGKYLNHINWENGEIKSKWAVRAADFKRWNDEVWENFKTWFNQTYEGFKNWFDTKIAPWFTKEKWSSLIGDAWSGLKSGWASTLQWFKDKVKFPEIKLPAIKWPHIKMPRFSIVGSMNPLDWIKGGGLPKLDVKFYADGGMPDIGEMFIAREDGPELVGKMGGRNAVMNNNQIVQSVSTGVAQAVSSVLGGGNKSSKQAINVFLYPNSDAYAKATLDDIDDFIGRTGYEPGFV